VKIIEINIFDQIFNISSMELLKKLSDYDFKTILAYLVIMVCGGLVMFTCLFEYGGIKPREFQDLYFSKFWRISSFYVGLFSLLSMLMLTGWFATKVVFAKKEDDHTLMRRLLSKIEFPTIITERKTMNIVYSSDSANHFYGSDDLCGESYMEIDERVKEFMLNWDEWHAVHVKRIELAKVGGLDSTTEESMNFSRKHLGHNEWRLTSCPLRVEGNKYYFTIISPAKENDLSA